MQNYKWTLLPLEINLKVAQFIHSILNYYKISCYCISFAPDLKKENVLPKNCGDRLECHSNNAHVLSLALSKMSNCIEKTCLTVH